MELSLLCSICSQTRTSSFCTCNPTETFLNPDSFPVNSSGDEGNCDPASPLEAFGNHIAPAYSDRIGLRLDAVASGKNTLRGQIEQVDRCIAEFSAKIQEVIRVISEYGQTTIIELNQVKAEFEAKIHAASEEAERSIYEGGLLLTTDPSLRVRQSDDDICTQLFTYQIRAAGNLPKSILELTHSYEDNLAQEDTLPQICKNSITIFNVTTGLSTSATFSHAFSDATMFCLLDKDSVLCVGGRDPITSSVFVLSLSNYSVIAVQSMRHIRAFPGIVKVGQFVYVFGGWISTSFPQNTAEKFGIAQQAWKRLPDMHSPKMLSSPCVFAGEVYLPFPNQPLEVFSPKTDTFRTIQVAFEPTGFNLVCNGLLSFVKDGEIVSLTPHKELGRYKIGRDTKFTISSFEAKTGANVYSNVPPLVVGKHVYWTDHLFGKLITFDTETLQVSDS